MNPNYLKGRRLEYEIQHKLQNAGWLAVRTAGSHSPIDIIAIRHNKIRVIQCKAKPMGEKALRSLHLSILKALAPYGIPNIEMNISIEICYKGKDGMQIWSDEG